MAKLFTVNSPLLLRFPDQTETLVAEIYPHEQGLVYLTPYWLDPAQQGIGLLKGSIKGEGPWKVGDVIIRLLSCGDTELSMQWASWQQDVLMSILPNDYYNVSLKQELLLNAGALL